MNNSQTIEQLKKMRISAMADLHQEHVKNNSQNENTPDEYLAILTEHEWEHRQNQRITRLIKQAKFSQKANLEEVDYSSVRNLDKNNFTRLATLEFMERKENLIITGASGVGKSYLGQALGHQACFKNYRVLYSNTARLFTKFKLAKVDGTYIKELQKLQKINLLILDDFGLQAFDNNARDVLLDIIDDRFNKMSTIVSSQLPVSLWHDIIGEKTIADAILDRLVNSSHRINLNGESLRKGFLNKKK